jgi:hypothetical protein
MTTSASSAALSGRSTYGTRSGVAAANSYRRLGRCCTPRSLAPSFLTPTSRTSRSTTSTRLVSLAATGSASNTALPCRLLPKGTSIRSVTGMHSSRVEHLHPLAAGPNARIVRLDHPGLVHWREEAGTGLASPRPRPGRGGRADVQARDSIRRQSPGPAAARASAGVGGLVKGIVDGVISAFQAHTDTTVLLTWSHSSRKSFRRSP